jgi:two-component system sensor histidine kinase/response regulator
VLPILAMTANAMQSDREQCAAAGMNDFIMKPVEPEQLWQALARWIRPRSGLPVGADPLRTAPGPAPAARALPSGVAGLDTSLGLRRAMGRQALYLDLLGKFARTQDQAPVQIRAALQAGDRVLARRLAHTLRGLAGNLGAELLQARAAELEQAIGGALTDAALAPLIEALDDTLAPLVAALQQAEPVAARTPPAPSPASPASAEVKARLQNLLMQADGDAVDYFAAHRSALRAALGPGFDSLARAVDDYDFERAASLLNGRVAN